MDGKVASGKDIEIPRAAMTIEAIERAVEATQSDRPYPTLRCSELGKACERAIWYRHRWATPPARFSGRMLRLFNTGHVEEARMVAWLRLSGATVDDVDPATGDQFAFEACDKHLTGHCDGRIEGLLEAPKTAHLLECKTHNAKSFAQLVKNGVAVAKPEHMAQMQLYMHLGHWSRAVYLAKNKDTDELHLERVHYDAAHAHALIARAERILAADEAPPRISDDPASFLCRFCDHAELCHRGAWPVRNCRTCGHSKPGANGPAWDCERHGRSLTPADQEAGCPNHLFRPSLIPGEQIDANPETETITYRLPDGSEWIDGLKEQRA